MRDIKDEVIDFSNGTHLKISCVARDKQYAEEFELFEPINADVRILLRYWSMNGFEIYHFYIGYFWTEK